MKKWSDQKFIRSLFNDVFKLAEIVGDMLPNFRMTSLVDKENFSKYIASLDREYLQKSTSNNASLNYPRASWFAGQQVKVDFDGKISNVWAARGLTEEKNEDYKDL